MSSATLWDEISTDLPVEQIQDALPEEPSDGVIACTGQKEATGAEALGRVLGTVHGATELAVANAAVPGPCKPQLPDKCNSSTHRKEWADFIRQCSNQSSFPVNLTSMHENRRMDLFRLFLENDCSLKKVSLAVERTLAKKEELKAGWAYLKPRDIIDKIYPKEKAQNIIAKRKESGHYVVDDAFPEDEDEFSFLVKVENTLSIKD